jgi:hypothetical protein
MLKPSYPTVATNLDGFALDTAQRFGGDKYGAKPSFIHSAGTPFQICQHDSIYMLFKSGARSSA